MKVIKEGDGNRVKCHCCGATLEYEPKDVTVVHRGDDDDGYPIYAFYVSCPKCRDRAHITPTDAMRSRILEADAERDDPYWDT